MRGYFDLKTISGFGVRVRVIRQILIRGKSAMLRPVFFILKISLRFKITMAITGRPAGNGKSIKQKVVGASEVKSNLVAEGVRRVKNLNACRAVQDINQREHVAAAGNLSSIDDSEVVGYLNNTKEIHYKKIIWEKMNREYTKGDDKLHAKKRKRETGGKKDVRAKKSAAKTIEKVENKKQVPVETELGGVEPKACANGDSNENLKIGFHENEYGEDDDSSRDNDDDLYYG